MTEYIPPKHYIPHAKELLLERIKVIENCLEKPFDTAELIALQEAVLVLDAYETGDLVERKDGGDDRLTECIRKYMHLHTDSNGKGIITMSFVFEEYEPDDFYYLKNLFWSNEKDI